MTELYSSLETNYEEAKKCRLKTFTYFPLLIIV